MTDFGLINTPSGTFRRSSVDRALNRLVDGKDRWCDARLTDAMPLYPAYVADARICA